jgi:hypothetical protein
MSKSKVSIRPQPVAQEAGAPVCTTTEDAEAKALVPVTLGGVTFELAESGPAPTFVLGIRKSGSSMLNDIVEFLAIYNGITYVDVAGRFFEAGITVPEWEKLDFSGFLRPGNLYAGFRTFPKPFVEDPLYIAARKIVLLRDPRDALVSQYYSDAYSHSLPEEDTETGRAAAAAFRAKREKVLAMSIDDYVLAEAQSFNYTCMQFVPVMRDPNRLVFRYEEIILHKSRFIHKLAQHLGLQVSKEAVEEILEAVDLVPETEDPSAFVRRVLPGDHRRKLRPETIEALDIRLKNSLRLFDYY